MDQKPIFIGGLAHTGKTILRLLLSSHPEIAITRRSHMWDIFYNQFGDLSQPSGFERCLTAMLVDKNIRMLQPDPDRIRAEFCQGPPTYARLFALFQTHYVERLGKTRWGEQLGLVERFAGPIFSAFPEAKMIHMVRNPLDRYKASKKASQHRRGKAGWATARWLFSANLAHQNRKRYNANYKVVRYETLVSQPQETLREICAFIGEKFLPTMITMQDATLLGDKKPEGVDARAGTNMAVVVSDNGSRETKSQSEVAFMQMYAGREMLSFDYQLQPVRFSLRERVLFSFVDWPANRAAMLAWKALRARWSAQLLSRN